MVRGFLLNNQLTDFDFEANKVNSVGPGKRPRSSMAPALGSPGGSAIINYVAKTLVAALDWNLDIQSAIEVPNFGSRNGPTQLEQGTGYEALSRELTDRNHPVEIVPLASGLHGIERTAGGWRGGADPRRGGSARGD